MTGSSGSRKIKEIAVCNDKKENDKIVIASRVKVADTFFKRFIGLMGTARMDKGSALLIYPCRQVHTFFMFTSIDIIFLDRENKLLHLIESMPPFRISPYIKESYKVLELPPQTITKFNITGMDRIKLQS